jgi:hypothetical protein
MIPNIFKIPALTALLVLAGGAREKPGWDEFVRAHVESDMALNPGFAVSAGRHDYDGELPDWSEAGLKRQAGFLTSALAVARGYRDSELSAPQRFERDYLVTTLRDRLFWLTDADEPHSNPAYYFRGGINPGVYAARPYAPDATRMRAMIAYLKRVPTAATQIRANLRLPLPAAHSAFGISAFGGLASYYGTDGKAAFATVNDAGLQREYDAAAKDAAAAMQGLADWLRSKAGSTRQDFALGAARYSRMLAETSMVDIPLERLERIGQADLARNKARLAEVCARYLPGGAITACIAKAAADKSADGPVALAERQVEDLRAFVIDRRLLTIPGTEKVLVRPAPPYNARNLAFIDPAGPYDVGLPSIYYISPPDPGWPKEKQLAYIPSRGNLLSITAHEVMPGHFVQILHANRATSQIARLYSDYAFVEGWAHYVEEMIQDAGYGDGDPAVQIGQLTNALLRNVRFVSSIGLHTRGMTQEESRRMFIDDAYQDPGSAEQQAARGIWDPGYLNYTLGKLMILKLREDWMRSHGPRASLKDFHDSFLSFGGPPIPLIRRAMLRNAGPAL